MDEAGYCRLEDATRTRAGHRHWIIPRRQNHGQHFLHWVPFKVVANLYPLHIETPLAPEIGWKLAVHLLHLSASLVCGFPKVLGLKRSERRQLQDFRPSSQVSGN